MSAILESAWADHRRWSLGASDLKARLDGAGRWAFRLAIAGMVLETLSSQHAWFAWLPWEPAAVGRVIGFLGALPLAASAFLSRRFLQPARRHAALLARAISESLKREAYLHRTGAEPYQDPATRDEILHRRHTDIVEPSEELFVHLRMPPADGKAAPPVLDPDAYVARRLIEKPDGQLTWYEESAARHDRRADRLQTWALALGWTAVVLGVVNGSFELPSVGVWVSVVTAIGTAVAAHLTANRHDFLRVSYRAAAGRLRRRLDRWRLDAEKDADGALFRAFVRDCEDIMAAENQSWIARGKEL